MKELIGYIFIALGVASGIGMLLTKNLFRAALYFMIILLCIAALYVLASAEFLAVTQILIYAGGVVVIIIFGIMLTTKISGNALQIINKRVFSAMILCCGLAFIFWYSFSRTSFEKIKLIQDDNVRQTGINLMTSHLFPFEIIGVLLLVALVGASVLSSNADKS